MSNEPNKSGTKPAIQHSKSILDDRRIRLLLAIVGAIVVSEETGIISMAKNGVLIRHFDRQTLYTRLVDEMIPKETASEKIDTSSWKYRVKQLLNWVNQKEEDPQ